MDGKDTRIVVFLLLFSLLLSLALFGSLTYCVWNKQASELEDLHNKLQKLQNQVALNEFQASENSQVKGQLKRNVRQADGETDTLSATEILTNALTEIIEMKLISYMDCNRNDYNYTKCTLKPGPKGEPGDTGSPGMQGGTGKRGPRGPKGDTGLLGPQGPTGEKGTKGELGDMGQRGEPGSKGMKGNVGYPGYKGEKGKEGVDGPQGPPGPTGPQSPPGVQGKDGRKGEQGLAGPKGDLGLSGPQGLTGEKGTKGEPGDMGQRGEPGSKGMKGNVGYPGYKGEKGKEGVDGPQGPPGPTGPQGPHGVQGNDGRKGEQGLAGPKGDLGLSGPQGLTGEKGAKGDIGERGLKGDTGPPGPRGVTGEKGDMGQRGEPGSKGMKGNVGYTGYKGEKGVAGPQGPPGPTGPQGAPGPPDALTAAPTTDATTTVMTTDAPTMPATTPGQCEGPGWRRVVFLNMTDPSHVCPSGLRLTSYSRRTCGRASSTVNSCWSTTFSVGGSQYSRVCGRARAYRFGINYGFYGYYELSEQGIDSSYVDGLSLTHGGPGSRQHIWTFAGGLFTGNATYVFRRQLQCPCDNRNTYPSPPFVGNGDSVATPNNWGYPYHFYPNATLWDGEVCEGGGRCCQLNNPPWFTKNLTTPTTDGIELRLCLYASISLSDVALELLELYIH